MIRMILLSGLFFFGESSLPVSSAAQSMGVKKEEVHFRNSSVELYGSLLLPGGKAPAPAVVIIHGSGTSDQSNPWTAAYADALAKRGIAVLYPDKRGSGKSGGDWRTASFEDLAHDAKAGLEILRGRRDIDTSRLGVLAFSQGGYVASILAAQEPLCKFAVVVSGGVASLKEQTVNELELEAQQAGITVPEQEARALRSVYGHAYEFAATGRGWSALLDTLQVINRTNPLLNQALRTLPRDSTHWAWRWIRATGDFDPLPYWQRTMKPVVFLYAGKDTRVRSQASIQRIWTMRKDLGNFGIIYLGGNGHTHFRDDAVDFVTRWIHDKGVN